MSSEFWRSVKELAALREHVPEERRATSAVRKAILSDVNMSSPKSTASAPPAANPATDFNKSVA